MLPIKMLVTDIDGTLLRTDKTISNRTISALRQCREAGVKVVYATGRGGSADWVVPYELFDGKITMNGAVATVDGVMIYRRIIPHKTVRPLLLACDSRGLKIASQQNETHYANFSVCAMWPEITDFHIVDFSRHALDAEKLYMVVDTYADEAFVAAHLPEETYLTVTRDRLAMVMHKDATKTKAIAALAHFWNITQSEIVAFGDDLNDIDMLSYVGTGVAMGNALEEVKAAADYICGANDVDGVAKWLEERVIPS